MKKIRVKLDELSSLEFFLLDEKHNPLGKFDLKTLLEKYFGQF